MRRTERLQGLRLMKFEEVYGRNRGGALSLAEAAEVLGMSERTFRRWRNRYEAEGAEGLYDRRLGRVSGRRAPVDEVARVLELFDTVYKDFRTKHFHEKLVGEHGFGLSYNWLRLTLQAHNRVTPAPRRGAHRRKRPRRPMVGMMLHQDGSSHEWVPGRIWDLIVTLDDATSEIYAASFVDEEGTMSSFRALHQVIAEHGLFCALYADRGSHYWHTPAAGGKVDKDNPTQVGRALAQLGIELIPAYSPQARGRSERMFATLQDRLPKELALAGITTMTEANRFLEEVYLPRDNARFARSPEDTGSAFVPFAGNLEDVLCIQEERVVGNDNTVRYKNRMLQIPADRHRHHYVKVRVRVHEYPDGTLAVFHGPRCLARYSPEGEPITKVEQPGGVNRSDVAKACGYDGQRQAVAHIPTGPKTTTEAVNSSVT
jgi:transposase